MRIKIGLGLVLVAQLAPSAAFAQGPTIDHDAIGCVVAGKYPRMSACFKPASVARARVYFRGEGPHWYWVGGTRKVHEAIGSQGEPVCYDYVLPKPKKSLKKLYYYVEGVDDKFGEGRSSEYAPDVVPDRGVCRKEVVAGFLDKANVVVGAAPGAPAFPLGFAAGTSSALVIGVIAGGAAIGGGVVATTGGGGSGSSTTTTTTLPPTGASSTTFGTTTTTTSTTATTSTTSTTTTTTTSTTTTSTLPACRAVDPRLDAPKEGASLTGRVNVSCTVPGARRGCPDRVVLKFSGASGSGTLGTFTVPPYDATWDTTSVPNGPYVVGCVADFGAVQRSAAVNVRVANVVIPAAGAPASAPARGSDARWTSRLEVPGGRGQIVLDGTIAVYDDGRQLGSGRGLTAGEHRVEAQLVAADGAGRWTFELGRAVAPGSLRILAGDAALLGTEAIVFRMAGRSGERVVFVFRTE